MTDLALDVVVVNYRTPDDLAEFLESLDACWPDFPMQVWVMNVAPTPKDEIVAQDWIDLRPNEITQRVFSENVGYARAVNRGVLLGEHPFIAIFNADVALLPNALEGCVEALADHVDDDWAIVGPRQVDEQRRITHAGIFGTLARPQHRAFRQRAGDRYQDIVEAVTVAGSAYFIRREVWDELHACPMFREVAGHDVEGAFLPTSHYYEETWCSYHAQAHGHKVIYLGTETVVHKWHRASPIGGWAEKQIPRSRALFRAACSLHGIPHD